MIQLPILTKPRYGEKCNGCGLCCIKELCQIAKTMHPEAKAPCQYLEYDAGRSWCGLVRHPKDYTPLPELMPDAIALSISACCSTLLGIGKGCCTPDYSL